MTISSRQTRTINVWLGCFTLHHAEAWATTLPVVQTLVCSKHAEAWTTNLT